MKTPTNALASEKVTKAAAAHPKNRGELSGIHVQPAENGYVVTSHYESKGKGVMPDPTKHVFPSHKGASAHVASLLADHAKTDSPEK